MIEGSIRIQKIEDCDGIDLLAGAFPADEAEEGFFVCDMRCELAAFFTQLAALAR